MIKLLGLAAFASLLAMPAAAQPLSPETAHEVQCFIAASSLVGNPDKNTSTIGLMGSFYFAGEVFGSDPHIDLAAAVKAEAQGLTDERVKALLTQCGAEMTDRGKEITAAGQQLQGPSAQTP